MNLKDFFEEHRKVAVALSGGVDSSYLFCEAVRNGADARAYFVESAFQPPQEKLDAEHAASDIGASDRLTIIRADILSHGEVTANPENRCYYCKKHIFGAILRQAAADGYDTVLDGTNASDDPEDRPGKKALEEMEVLSPLLECGLTKEDIRRNAREEGLFNWNKPSNACLATRIPYGEKITEEKLLRVNGAEEELKALGFTDLRVRKRGETGLIQIPEKQFAKAAAEHESITKKLSPYFKNIALDLKPRSSR
ncbi:MAG: ATP-dependent sacrificial sulfur transferase LarE [Anaerovoracaceae bacterium]|jgi:uncharacterized protein